MRMILNCICPCNENNQITLFDTCIKDVKSWMTVYFLFLIKVIVTGPTHLQEALLNCTVNSDHTSLASSSTVINLGVIYDQDLSFNSNMKQVIKIAFLHLRNIRESRNILTQEYANESMLLLPLGWIVVMHCFLSVQTVVLKTFRSFLLQLLPLFFSCVLYIGKCSSAVVNTVTSQQDGSGGS